MAKPGLALCALRNGKDTEVPCTIIKYLADGARVLVRFEGIDMEYVKKGCNVRPMPFGWKPQAPKPALKGWEDLLKMDEESA